MTQSTKSEQNPPKIEAEDKSQDALRDAELDNVAGGFGGQGQRSRTKGA
ncbi:hypothetical protein [Devosia chinhatensis]|nr:hypothetical protein [Devosia chinhatensis]